MIASVGSTICGASRSWTRTSPGPCITAPRIRRPPSRPRGPGWSTARGARRPARAAAAPCPRRPRPRPRRPPSAAAAQPSRPTQRAPGRAWPGRRPACRSSRPRRRSTAFVPRRSRRSTARRTWSTPASATPCGRTRAPRSSCGSRTAAPRRRGSPSSPPPRTWTPRRPSSAEDAAAAVIDRFGRIDVLVNNAGSFLAGFFEELTTEQVRAQIETNLLGPMTVTRAVLPVMRRQRAGLVISISSGAGQIGSPSGSAYSASKFALEGWMESLTGEVEPFGIRTMIVEPGFFRTELLTPESTAFGELSIDDYDDARAQSNAFWASMNGTQAGDPAKLARALVELADSDEPPLRWVAGEDVVEGVEDKARLLLAQVDAHRALSTSLAHDDAKAPA